MAAPFGRRLRRGVTSTAIAAVAMAALGASAAPGLIPDRAQPHRGDSRADTPPQADDSPISPSPFFTDLPPLQTPHEPGTTVPTGVESGIPATVLDAYKKAQNSLRGSQPGCNLPWQLLAAIGKVESGHARGGRVDTNGKTLSPILGPVLNGSGFANISDTDNGRFDGDSRYDRAVGPMQFIPSTWAKWGRDANGDGTKDPNNVYDAALAAGSYLCAGGRDLSRTADLHRAILGYNNSQDYLRLVLKWYEFYRNNAHEIPNGQGPLPRHRSDQPAGSGSGSSDSGGGHGGGDGGNHSATPHPSPSPGDPNPGGGGSSPSPSPTPTEETVARLTNATGANLTTPAGTQFPTRPAIKAVTSGGKAVSKVRVAFSIVGSTDTRFSGGASTATVTTSSSGVATAPVLKAGTDTGAFTVKAKVVSRSVSVSLPASVTAAASDKLARTSDTALTAAAGGEFAATVEVKATWKGQTAGGVAATATMITAGDDPKVNDAGPYFKNAQGDVVRQLEGLRTDADGLLQLPKIYAGDKAGTYLLRIATNGGGALTLELKVT